MEFAPPIELATLSMWDTLLLMALALVVFGPRRLPKIGRQLGKLMYEFRKASNDFKFQMDEELRHAEEAERRQKDEAARQQTLVAPLQPQLQQSANPAPDACETPASGTSTPASETTTPQAPSAPAAEQPIPRIQPPSSGETVAAERPGKAPESGNSEAGSEAGSDAGPEAERTEPAAYHAPHD